jgi:hypothetical protein
MKEINRQVSIGVL